MAILKIEHKQFIVQSIACFRSHTETKDGLHATFGIEASLQQIYNLDPTKLANADRIAKDLRELFAKARAEYIANAESQPLAHPGYRLERLLGLVNKAEKAGSTVVAAQLINQAREEMSAIRAAPTAVNPHASTGTAAHPITDAERATRLLEVLKSAAEGGG